MPGLRDILSRPSGDQPNLKEILDAATPGPWKECGADRGGCSCGNIWSLPADAPVGRIIADEELERAGWIRRDKASRVADMQLAALAPELAALCLDMGEWIRRYPMNDLAGRAALLARLSRLGAGDSNQNEKEQT